MTFKKILFLAVIGSLLVGCSTPPPSQPFPKSAENSCMVNVFEKIKLVRTNIKEQSNSSKENQCYWAAERRGFWSNIGAPRTPRSVQNAAGNVVIQQSINIQNTNPQAAKDEYYRECMRNPNIQAFVAPPAYVQLEGMVFGFKSISTENCPGQFALLMNNYIDGAQHVVDVMKRYPHLNTADQNQITRKQVPTNEMEKEIIDARNPSVSTFVKMVDFFAKTTGWCPGNNGLFRCDPNNIPFRQ